VARLVLVSNRVPSPADRGVRAGGLVAALSESISGGLWFGWSGQSGDATGTEATQRRSRGVTYATIDLSHADYERYYVGFSNSTLWPLLHYRLGLMEFEREQYHAYVEVNRAFATALRPLLQPGDVIWVHDYHLIPLGAMLREMGVANRIGFFLHVPFVPPSAFAVMPNGNALLSSLGAYDLVGVQTRSDLQNLEDCLREFLGWSIEGSTCAGSDGRVTRLGAFPIGIDATGFAEMAVQGVASAEGKRLRESLGRRALIMGVDRLDYSKGLPNRFHGFSRLLARCPEHHQRITYVQVAARSRDDVPQYQAIRRELDRLAGRVNGRFGTIDWVPLRYVTRPVPRATLAGFFRMARVGLVTPLRDGMNLVAKEYVAAQDAEDPGVLILSRFAGAVHELAEALVVNPIDVDEIAEALDSALRMSLDERKERWQRMWERVRTDSAATWRSAFLTELKKAG
jgi:trehalose 6-phosphate synthase